ncbi:transcriptional regulator [Archaeoglobales archaeon]|nr:MAG: transcriptional regulator [Archaeoglobales archaeon]
MEKGLETIKALSYSLSKLKILEVLNKPQNLSEISESLKKAKPTVAPHLKTLIELGLIERDNEMYVISEIGEVAYKKLVEIIKFFDVVANLKKFFKQHDLTPIPDFLLKDIYMLYGGVVFEKENPYEFHKEWWNILLSSRWIYGLSSVYHKDFPNIFTELSKKKEVKLIVTESIFERIIEVNERELNEFLNRGEMFVCKSVKLTFVTAEKGFTMNLYENSYDASQILICKTKDAVEWGLKLFSYYLSQSRRVEL